MTATLILGSPNLRIDLSTNDGVRYYALLHRVPFAIGSVRLAFKGWLYGETGREPRHGTQCVIKTFIHSDMNTSQKCDFELHASVTAQEYAKRFNIEMNKLKSDSVDFLVPLVARIDHVDRGFILEPNICFKSGIYVTIEQFLYPGGTYTKFNSNGGWEDRSHPRMSAFCHWTWEYSSNNHMVCDLQGVYYTAGQKYILTDPAIHSQNGEFGMTDLGQVGMYRVMNNHQCNAICNYLGLTEQLRVPDWERKSTTYDFQLVTRIRRI